MQIGTSVRCTAALLCLLLLSGCAWMRSNEAAGMERSLAAAGFTMQFADTPEQRAELAKLPPRKLVKHPKGGEVVWVYGDPTSCKCLYVGSQAAYRRYEQRVGAQENAIVTSQEMDWGVWGGD
jgi:hypothetical protein